MLPAMARQNSFDIVSKVNLAEVKNAVNQALKEVHQRFDLKNSHSDIQLHADENKIVLTSREEATCAAVDLVLRQRLARRGVSLKALTYGVVEPAAKDSVRQSISLQQGIPREKAREIEGQRAPEHLSAAGDPQREGPGDRQADQEEEDQGPGRDPE